LVELVTPTSNIYKSFEIQFKKLWNEDLCNTYDQFLKFCHPEKITLEYYPEDNYRDFVVHGL